MSADYETLLRQLQNLQTQVNNLQHQLQRNRIRRRSFRAVMGAAVVALLCSWAAYSQTSEPEFTLMKQVASLETRMETIEKQLASGKFKAPFSVVDEKGAPIMSVFSGSNRGIYVLNDATKPGVTAKGVSIEAGDQVGVRVRSDNQQAWMGSLQQGIAVYVAGGTGEDDIRTLMDYEGGFEVRRTNKRVAALGVTAKNNIALRLYSPTYGPTHPLVAMGVTTNDNHGGLDVTDATGKLLTRINSVGNKAGFVSVYPASDTPSASMQINDTGGLLAVTDPKGTAIASLSQGKDGGKLQLTDFTGEVLVKAGVTDDLTGAVYAGPENMPSGIAGLPSSFIVGKRAK